MDTCRITFETLLDYAEGRLSQVATQQIRTHLEGGCASCREQLVWLGRFLPALHNAIAEPEAEAPAAAIAFAQNLARQNPLAPPRPTFRQFIAQLLFDNRQQLVLAGARGENNRGRQRLFATDEHYIDLWEERLPDGNWYLIGQIMPKEGDNPLLAEEAQLTANEETTYVAHSEGSEFHLPSVPAGAYRLTLRCDGAEILISSVIVGGE